MVAITEGSSLQCQWVNLFVCVCEMTKIIFTAMKKMASNVINSTTN